MKSAVLTLVLEAEAGTEVYEMANTMEDPRRKTVLKMLSADIAESLNQP